MPAKSDDGESTNDQQSLDGESSEVTATTCPATSSHPLPSPNHPGQDSGLAGDELEKQPLAAESRYLAVPTTRRVWNVDARDAQQAMAMELLMDPKVSLVTLVGRAGTGKTLLALAAGLEQVVRNKRYSRILVTRATTPVGQSLGYLPGSIEEKMAPWIAPLLDNLSFISSVADSQESKNPYFSLQTEDGRLQPSDLLVCTLAAHESIHL